MKLDGISVVGFLLSTVLATVLVFTVYGGFPAFLYGSPAQSLLSRVGDLGLISRVVSFSLWNIRAMDVIVLAIILFSTAISCIALLRRE